MHISRAAGALHPPGINALYAWIPLPSGHVVNVKSVSPAAAEAMLRGDVRTHPVHFDVQGERLRDYNEAVTLLRQDNLPGSAASDLDGPRTFLTVAKNNRTRGLTFRSDYEKWLVSANIHDGDRSKWEAEVIVETLDALLMVDQLNGSNLLSAEILVRRWQLIKEVVCVNLTPTVGLPLVSTHSLTAVTLRSK